MASPQPQATTERRQSGPGYTRFIVPAVAVVFVLIHDNLYRQYGLPDTFRFFVDADSGTDCKARCNADSGFVRITSADSCRFSTNSCTDCCFVWSICDAD